MQTTLNLIPARTAHRETVAWFVLGCDPQTWLDEMSRWQVPLDSLELRLVPRSIDESTLIGVLVTPRITGTNRKTLDHASSSKPMTQTALRYGQVAGRLYVPVDANMTPDVSDHDLLSLLPSDNSDFIWHPSAGLIRFESHDRIRIVDLLMIPTERKATWDLAIPGMAFRSRMISVEAELSLTADEVLSNAASGIGSQAASIDELPPTPDEWFGGKLNRWTRPLRDAWRKMTSRQPPRPAPDKTRDHPVAPGSGTGAGSFSKWIGGAFGLAAGAAAILGRGLSAVVPPLGGVGAAVNKMMDRLAKLPFIDQLARNREIERLMHLLQTDPDKGLEFALPMNAESDSRGVASPGNQLVSRDINFNLNSIGGGSPADVWSIPSEQKYLLIQQYRELAAREIRLGRHRRAAYIFAKLLGDLVSAAGALESGHHYREAAAIYRDRLNRPVDAAKCLERAGLLDEAALIFIECGLFEQAAEIYVRLERPDEAERLLRSWAEQLLSNGDFRNASRVFHDKLADVDGALEALSRGWPSSSSAMWCFEESFRLLGQHARHDTAQNRIADLRKVPANIGVVKLIARGLAGVTKDYPEIAVRESAADTAQVVVARVLGKANLADTNELVESIRSLAPQDRLLARDCSRYIRQRQEAFLPKPAVKKSRGITLVNSFSLSQENVDWRIARSAGKSAYVAGFGNSSLVLQRLDFENPGDQHYRAFWAGVSDLRRLALEPFPGDASDLIIHPIGSEPIEKRGLPTNRGMGYSMSLAGSPAWATKSTVALAYAEGGIGWRIREVFGTLEIASISPKGEPLIVKDLAIPFDSQHLDTAKVTLFTAARKVRIGIGPHLCRPKLNHGISMEVFPIDYTTLDSDIESLTGSRVDDQSWLIALFETGGLLIDDDDHDVRRPIGEELISPCATFLQGGRFVVAGIGEVQAYEIDNARPVLIGRLSLDIAPIAVTATNKIGEFAVFGQNGTVQILKIH